MNVDFVQTKVTGIKSQNGGSRIALTKAHNQKVNQENNPKMLSTPSPIAAASSPAASYFEPNDIRIKTSIHRKFSPTKFSMPNTLSDDEAFFAGPIDIGQFRNVSSEEYSSILSYQKYQQWYSKNPQKKFSNFGDNSVKNEERFYKVHIELSLATDAFSRDIYDVVLAPKPTLKLLFPSIYSHLNALYPLVPTKIKKILDSKEEEEISSDYVLDFENEIVISFKRVRKSGIQMDAAAASPCSVVDTTDITEMAKFVDLMNAKLKIKPDQLQIKEVESQNAVKIDGRFNPMKTYKFQFLLPHEIVVSPYSGMAQQSSEEWTTQSNDETLSCEIQSISVDSLTFSRPKFDVKEAAIDNESTQNFCQEPSKQIILKQPAPLIREYDRRNAAAAITDDDQRESKAAAPKKQRQKKFWRKILPFPMKTSGAKTFDSKSMKEEEEDILDSFDSKPSESSISDKSQKCFELVYPNSGDGDPILVHRHPDIYQDDVNAMASKRNQNPKTPKKTSLFGNAKHNFNQIPLIVGEKENPEFIQFLNKEFVNRREYYYNIGMNCHIKQLIEEEENNIFPGDLTDEWFEKYRARKHSSSSSSSRWSLSTLDSNVVIMGEGNCDLNAIEALSDSENAMAQTTWNSKEAIEICDSNAMKIPSDSENAMAQATLNSMEVIQEEESCDFNAMETPSESEYAMKGEMPKIGIDIGKLRNCLDSWNQLQAQNQESELMDGIQEVMPQKGSWNQIQASQFPKNQESELANGIQDEQNSQTPKFENKDFDKLENDKIMKMESDIFGDTLLPLSEQKNEELTNPSILDAESSSMPKLESLPFTPYSEPMASKTDETIQENSTEIAPSDDVYKLIHQLQATESDIMQDNQQNFSAPESLESTKNQDENDLQKVNPTIEMCDGMQKPISQIAMIPESDFHQNSLPFVTYSESLESEKNQNDQVVQKEKASDGIQASQLAVTGEKAESDTHQNSLSFDENDPQKVNAEISIYDGIQEPISQIAVIEAGKIPKSDSHQNSLSFVGYSESLESEKNQNELQRADAKTAESNGIQESTSHLAVIEAGKIPESDSPSISWSVIPYSESLELKKNQEEVQKLNAKNATSDIVGVSVMEIERMPESYSHQHLLPVVPYSESFKPEKTEDENALPKVNAKIATSDSTPKLMEPPKMPKSDSPQNSLPFVRYSKSSKPEKKLSQTETSPKILAKSTESNDSGFSIPPSLQPRPSEPPKNRKPKLPTTFFTKTLSESFENSQNSENPSPPLLSQTMLGILLDQIFQTLKTATLKENSIENLNKLKEEIEMQIAENMENQSIDEFMETMKVVNMYLKEEFNIAASHRLDFNISEEEESNNENY